MPVSLAERFKETGRQRSDEEIANALNPVQWDFPQTENDPIHSVHPYPAKFTARIPRTLIDLIGVPAGTVVFDPFCGAGTTLVEGWRAGHDVVGVDLNPIACLMSRVKTTPLPAQFTSVAMECVVRAQTRRDVNVPAIPNVDHWFSVEAQHAIANLTEEFENFSDDSSLSDHLRLALSSILIRVSFQDSDTRYAAMKRSVSRKDVYDQFLSACARIAGAKTSSVPQVAATVIEHDILTLTARDLPSPVGLVVTSPPYPNAYEYWLYHKYRMWWLGFDPLLVKKHEIGARAHFFKKNHATAEDFIGQMNTVFSLIGKVLVPGGVVCVVVGRSRIHGRDIDNGALISAVASDHGMRPVFAATRTIAPNRKSFNLSHARIKTENVIVFRN